MHAILYVRAGIILHGKEQFQGSGNQIKVKYTYFRCFMSITISYGRVAFGT